MGSFDRAEACEVVGFYLLNKITKPEELSFSKNNVGLYRDDGLAAVHGSGPEIDKIWKKVIRLFKEEGLQITVEASSTKTDYLDVVFDLQKCSTRPYRKPNNQPTYINVKTDHPPMIIKQLPKMIEKRLSTKAGSEKIFDEVKGQYQEALDCSGYKGKLEYSPAYMKMFSLLAL